MFRVRKCWAPFWAGWSRRSRRKFRRRRSAPSDRKIPKNVIISEQQFFTQRSGPSGRKYPRRRFLRRMLGRPFRLGGAGNPIEILKAEICAVRPQKIPKKRYIRKILKKKRSALSDRKSPNKRFISEKYTVCFYCLPPAHTVGDSKACPIFPNGQVSTSVGNLFL